MEETGQEELGSGLGDSENGFESGFVQVSEADALLASQGVEDDQLGLEEKKEEEANTPALDSDEDLYGGPEDEGQERTPYEGHEEVARDEEDKLEDEEKPLSPPPSPVTPEQTGQLIDFGSDEPLTPSDPLVAGPPENQDPSIPITSYIVDTETSFDLVKTTPPEIEPECAATAHTIDEPAPPKATPSEPAAGLGDGDADIFANSESVPQEVPVPSGPKVEARPPPPPKIEKRVSFSDQPQWSDEPRPPAGGVEDVAMPPASGPTSTKKSQLAKPSGYLEFLTALHPVVLYIIYWCDVKLSAVVLGVCLVVLLTLTLNTVLHTTVLLLLSFMVVSLTYIITKIAIDSFYNKKVQNPFHGYLTNRITLPEKEIMEWTGYVVSRLTVYINILVRLLLFANIKYSLVFGCVLWLASFFTNCLTLLSALFLFVAVSFSVPWLYARFQSKIDGHLDKVVSKVGSLLKKVMSYIPIGKKSKTE